VAGAKARPDSRWKRLAGLKKLKEAYAKRMTQGAGAYRARNWPGQVNGSIAWARRTARTARSHSS